jgi:hypothetical protein
MFIGIGQGPIIQSKKVEIESIKIDYEQLLGKLKKHLKRVQHADIATIKYFVHDYIYPKTKKVHHVDLDDPLVVQVSDILYDLSPRVKRIVDADKDRLNGSFPSLMGKTITLPKIRSKFPEFPLFHDENESIKNIKIPEFKVTVSDL